MKYLAPSLILKNVTIQRDDNINVTLGENIPYKTNSTNPNSYYRLTVGEVVKDHTRTVEWVFEVNNSAVSENITIPIRYGAMNFNQTETNTSVLVENDLSLSAGWSYLSFHKLPTNKSVQNVLSSLDGSYEKIQTYNTCTGEWKTYDVNVPSGYNQTLENITGGEGYYIYLSQADILDFSGTDVAPVNISLCSGWNIFGWPKEKETVSTALNSVSGNYKKIQTKYDGSWETYDVNVPAGYDQTLDYIKAGGGYMIYMSANDTLEVA